MCTLSSPTVHLTTTLTQLLLVCSVKLYSCTFCRLGTGLQALEREGEREMNAITRGGQIYDLIRLKIKEFGAIFFKITLQGKKRSCGQF